MKNINNFLLKKFTRADLKVGDIFCLIRDNFEEKRICVYIDENRTYSVTVASKNFASWGSKHSSDPISILGTTEVTEQMAKLGRDRASGFRQ